MSEDMRAKLTRKLAELEAERQQGHATKKKLADRAKAQWDTMPKAIETVEKAAHPGRGGILTHRYLKTLHTERARIGQVIQDLEPDPDASG
jgi:hypothetical protein